jgi:Uma2 family endonuclease
VSAASIPQLLTVEEFERIPDPPGGRYELRHGEAVFVSFPERKHKELQRRLRKLLEQFAAAVNAQGVVDTEFPYRPLPQHELWGGDVAWCSQSRYDQIDKWLEGSPELVIEVKSPSNTKAELQDKAMTTLAGGAVEFWIVDYEKRIVTVYNSRSGMHVYTTQDAAPVPMFAARIDVDQLFENL